MLIQGKADRTYAKQLLSAVGLEHRMGNRLTQLRRRTTEGRYRDFALQSPEACTRR